MSCRSSFGLSEAYKSIVDPATDVDLAGDAANEPSLAVSPADPRQIVVGWRQFDTIASSFRRAGVARSADGGHTWSGIGTLPVPPPDDPATQQTDPVLACDSVGQFFYWTEKFSPSFALFVYRSTNGGATWPTFGTISTPTSGDKGWLEIDRTGGMGNGHQYGVWTGDLSTAPHIQFVRSTDGGATFSSPVRISDATGTKWMSHIAIGPDGEVYIAWRNYSTNQILITKSINAKNAAETPTFDAFGAGGANGLDRVIAASNDPGGISLNPVGFHQIWLGVDRSGGAFQGRVYCLWAATTFDVCDVFATSSQDGGVNWSAPLRVNDDPVGNGVYQWMAAMDVAPDGRIDAVWYDTRDDPGNARSSLYYGFSTNGGVTWSANRRISNEFDTLAGFPSQQKIGDYNQIRSDAKGVHIAYSATYNGGQDLYYLREYTCGRPGDLNGDRRHDALDLPLFVGVLVGSILDPQVVCRADLNADGASDLADLPLFVDTLLGLLAW